MIFLRNVISLIFAIILAFLGIKFCIYGVIVSVTDPDLHEVPMQEINAHELGSKRYLDIQNAVSVSNPLEYLDERGNTTSYVYPLFDNDSFDGLLSNTTTHLIIESEQRISEWDNVELIGLLKPYWYKIDPSLVTELAKYNISVSPNCHYLKIGTEPLKWYWYLIILGIAALFFYRMFEAIIKGIKNRKKPANET